MRARSILGLALLGLSNTSYRPALAADPIFGDVLTRLISREHVAAGPVTEMQSREAEARAVRREHWDRLRTAGPEASGPAAARGSAVAAR